jgi:peptidoglycan/xylan/chitin deacetylase (PgdA/CDA1 family)
MMLGPLRTAAKAATLALFGSTPALGARVEAIAAAGLVPILNLHRISDDRRSAYPGIAPALFDDLVGWMKQSFDLVTFSDLAEPQRKRPRAILSFDDGYKDFVENAAPILRKHKVRANQNIIPAAIESGRPPYNIILQDFIGQAPENLLRETTLPAISADAAITNRVQAGQRASAYLKAMPIAAQAKITAALEPAIARCESFRVTPIMSREELRQIAPEHEIGAHSFEHATMTAETDAYLAADLKRCQNWFAETLAASPTIYAFPNGAANEHHVEMALAAGYKQILMVGEGFARSDGPCFFRFTMHGETARELRFRGLGGFEALKARPS